MTQGPEFDTAAERLRVDAARVALGAGRQSQAEYVALVDDLVTRLGRAAGWSSAGVALVGLGGYGRAELSPRSDIDLLFLTRRRTAGGASVDKVLYPLWDLAFDVGHGVRTPHECARLAEEDLAAATALLDARLLLGDPAVLDAARREAGIAPGGSRALRRWGSRLLDEVERRWARYGEVSHLLEPHLKEGRGGLRDSQATRWLSACFQGASPSVRLDPAKEAQARRGHDFLLRSRNALHLAAGRKTDHLTFEFHREVAGTVVGDAPLAAFFEELHRASHHVLAAWDEMEAACREAAAKGRLRPFFRRSEADVGDLGAEVETWAREGGRMPSRLRASLGARRDGEARDALHGAVASLIRRRVPLAPVLHELYHAGWLGLAAPEVEAVVHQVHYDARHAFTTGIHCIEALAAFENLWLGQLEKEEPHLTRVANSIERPWIARLAALCHDLGKGVKPGLPGHSEKGASIARSYALRLGFDEAEADAVGCLVARHHDLPSLAFGRDVENPHTWDEARRAASPPASSEELLALAFADLQATHPGSWSGIWSDWKRDLLISLCARTSPQAPDSGNHAEAAPAGGVTRREARQIPPDLLRRLLVLADGLGERPAVWEIERVGRSLVEVLGVTHAAPRILSSVTGCLSVHRFDILSLQVHTAPDGKVHLWVRAACPPDPVGPEELALALTRGLTGEVSSHRRKRSLLPNPRQEAVPVEVRVELTEGDDPYHSVLKVGCRDREGLMRDLARVFERFGLTVPYALITTVGPMAQDVFHLQDLLGGRIEGEDKRRALVEELHKVAAGT